MKSASLLIHPLPSGLSIVAFFLCSVLLHRIFQSFLKTTWKPGWPTSTASWLWIINSYKQMWVFFFFHLRSTFSILQCCKVFLTSCVCLCLFNVNSVGWGGSRPRGVAEVSDMWQRCSLRSEVRRRIPAISTALRHSYLEPFSFDWPGSQIWPGESSEPWLFPCSFWSSLSRC